MNSVTEPVAGHRSAVAPQPVILILTAFVVACLLIGFDLLDGRFYYRDIDDVLRTLQIASFWRPATGTISPCRPYRRRPLMFRRGRVWSIFLMSP